MQRFTMVLFVLSGVFGFLLMVLFVELHGLRVDGRRRATLILDLRQRLIKAEAALVQRRLVHAHLRLPLNTAGGLEGRVEKLEIEAQQSNELLFGFLHSKAPPVQDMIGLDQSSAVVADHIRKNLIVPPVSRFRLTQYAPQDLSRGNGDVLRHIFKNKKMGFFIESGALDGMWLSNTFYFERLLGWTGALIEPDAFNFQALLEKKRNVFALPTCLSRTTKPQLVPFTFGQEAYAKIDVAKAASVYTDNMLCMPLYSILLALNRTTIDLLSLDIEGHELDVLRTIPWDDVKIKVLIVEFLNIAEGKEALEKFMLGRGYAIFPSTPAERAPGKWAEDDQIFVKKGEDLNEY